METCKMKGENIMENVYRYNVRIYTPGKGWWGFMSSQDYEKAYEEYRWQAYESDLEEITQLVDMKNQLVLEESVGKLVDMDAVKDNWKSLKQDALDHGYTTLDKSTLCDKYNLPAAAVYNLLIDLGLQEAHRNVIVLQEKKRGEQETKTIAMPERLSLRSAARVYHDQYWADGDTEEASLYLVPREEKFAEEKQERFEIKSGPVYVSANWMDSTKVQVVKNGKWNLMDNVEKIQCR